jgi:2-keto-4-pentenoate hydratase/2-oxohepta-3-ene-1,7-dioic acid hydratase in catechol pathway
MPVPAEPILFSKAPNCCVGANDDIIIPKASTKLDWELELAFVIGTRASYVSEENALDHVAGYFICNDVSEREWQIERLGQWVKGKSAPTFGPVGPWLVTPDELGDVQSLDMWLDVNGQRQQTGNTRTMVFGVRKLVSYVSQFLTLDRGDIITTGTPPGVAMGRKPPNYLKSGDVISMGIQGLGEQKSKIIAYTG